MILSNCVVNLLVGMRHRGKGVAEAERRCSMVPSPTGHGAHPVSANNVSRPILERETTPIQRCP